MPSTAPVTATPLFAFIGGDRALDLVNTVDWTERGFVAERLPDYSAVVSWAVAAGVLPPALGERLRRRAAARPREAHAAHDRMRHVRGLLRAVFRGGADAPAALRELNPLIGDALGRLRLAPAGRSTPRLRWEWGDVDRRLDAPLWPVLRAAAELLVSDEAERIRTCDGADCGWMYVDRSRNGLRRWCQMRTCGTVEKTRRRRQGETH
jgi:predicted RNA-binding Zn ribbon-like protein